MRKLKYISFSLLLFVCFISCDSLDEVPLAEFSPENVYSDENSSATALWGVYASLQSRSSTSPLRALAFGATDVVVPQSWFRNAPQQDYRTTAVTTQVGDFWRDTYDGINRVNSFILQSSPEYPVNDPGIWIGEAKIIRAIHYFRLVRLFGEVPLVIEPVTDIFNAQPGKNSIEEIYVQVINDLEAAIEVLPPSNEISQQPRMSRGSAQGLLMQVYATMAGYPLNQNDKWQNVMNLFETIQSEGVHQLEPDYFKLFENLDNDIYDNDYYEIMVQVAFSDGAAVPGEGRDVGANGIGLPTYSWGQFQVPDPFVNKFDPLDTRFERNIAASEDIFRGVKYRPGDSNPPNTQNQVNLPLVRYADLMLLYAEALNEINNGPTQEAVDMVNAVRRRSRPDNMKDGTGDIRSDDVLVLNEEYDTFSEIIRTERAIELCYEFTRWYDLKRWNILIPTIRGIAFEATDNSKNNNASKNIDERHLRYPIPQGELDRNPNLMPQNPGY